MTCSCTEDVVCGACMTGAVDPVTGVPTPPANDVREQLDAILQVNNGYWPQTRDAILAEFEVRPRGTVTDAERLEYTVAAVHSNGAITSLSGESTVVREHLDADFTLYRADEERAGGEPDRIIIAQRPIPKWVRS